MVTEPDGTAHLVYATPTHHVARVRPNGGGWSSAETLGASSALNSFVRLTSNSSGRLAAAFSANSGGLPGDTTVFLARKAPGAAWGPSAVVSGDPKPRGVPRVTVTEAGETLVGWHDIDANFDTLGITLRAAPPGGDLGSAESAGGPGDGIADLESIGSETFLGTEPGTILRRVGTGWATDLSIAPSTPTDRPDPSIVKLSDGGVAAFWFFEDPLAGFTIRLAHRGGDGSWRTFGPIAGPSGAYAFLLLGGWGSDTRFIVYLLTAPQGGGLADGFEAQPPSLPGPNDGSAPTTNTGSTASTQVTHVAPPPPAATLIAKPAARLLGSRRSFRAGTRMTLRLRGLVPGRVVVALGRSRARSPLVTRIVAVGSGVTTVVLPTSRRGKAFVPGRYTLTVGGVSYPIALTGASSKSRPVR